MLSAYGDIFTITSYILGLFMVWTIASAAIARAIGTALSSNRLANLTIVITAVIFELLGAYVGGPATVGTLQHSLISVPQQASDLWVLAILSSMMATIIWVIYNNEHGRIPSASQSLIASIIVTTSFATGLNFIGSSHSLTTFIAWLLLPIGVCLAARLMQKLNSDSLFVDQPIAKPLLLIMVAGIAFAHGSNDIANILGPIFLITDNIELSENYRPLSLMSMTPVLILVMLCLAVVYQGRRYIITTAKAFPAMSQGQILNFCSISIIVICLCSYLGLLISVTQVFTAAIIGVLSSNRHEGYAKSMTLRLFKLNGMSIVLCSGLAMVIFVICRVLYSL